MFTEYIQAKLKGAKYKILEDETYFAEIPSLKGVWANAKTLENCREELREVLEDWTLLQVATHNKIRGLKISSPKSVKQYA